MVFSQHRADAAGHECSSEGGPAWAEEASSVRERGKQPSTRRLRSREELPERYPSDLSDQEWATARSRSCPQPSQGGNRA